jgi:hypothetical protein
MLANILRSTRVTMNTVYGAACIYLMLALAWASIFVLLEWMWPGSFTLELPAAASWQERFGVMARDSELFYFSMITLTTVGYGDISPISPPARTLAALEGLIGQLFLAIIIARMVGMELATRMSDRS